ncbi:MAG: PadR family transcriptional regulator [Methylocystis sp.]
MLHLHGGRHGGCDRSRKGFSFAEKFRAGAGFGKFMGGFMGGFGGDGSGFRTGRKLASQDLQLLLLALLARKPAHGYELIKTLEESSGGFYSPSPGMIYPALTYLEEIGFVSVEAEGAKKLYRPTGEGLAHLEQRRGEADEILSQLDRIGRRMGDFRRAFSGSEEDDADSADIRQHGRALRQALREKRHASPEEQRRVAEILRRAVEEITLARGR